MNWKKGCILGLATALSLGIGAGAKAAVLGCAANEISVPSEAALIAEAGYYDSGETWQIIVGDPIVIGVGSKGTMAVWLCQPNGFYAQYYDTSSWGNNFWLNGTDTSKHYQSPYYIDWYGNSGVAVSSVSHSKSVSGDTTTVTTDMDLGSDATVRQIVTYKENAYSYNMRWELKNVSGSAMTDVRFMHGGDTYFGDDDSARSWYDAGRKMVYVNNPNFNVVGIMGFYGSELTPADHYFGGSYSTGGDFASETARLPDTANSSYLDAGYQLEWDRATLANNATFVVEATEIFTDPTPIAVIAPSNQSTSKNVTTTLDFVVQNLDETNENTRVSPTTAHTLNLTAQSSQGWNVEIVGPAQVSLNWQDRVTVPVRVTVPSSVSNGTADNITLTATDSSNTSLFGMGTSKLTVVASNYEISDNDLNFSGSQRRRVITIRNNAAAGREGVGPLAAASGTGLLLGQVGGSNPLEPPFSIGDDTCSNQEIPEGSQCTIEVLYSPEGDGPFEDSFNIPVLSPVAQNWTVDVTGSGAKTLKTEKINYGCFIDSLTR